MDRRFVGAALTARPILGDLWRRRCEGAAIRYHTTSSEVRELAVPLAEETLVVLVDHPLGTRGNLAVIREHRALILLLAPAVAGSGVRAALDAGIDGMLTVADRAEHLDAALAHLLAGESYVSPSAARVLLTDYRHRSVPAAAAPLSERERDVLQDLVDGLSSKATARHLGISIKTVEAHRRRIFDRLQVRNRREAVTRALSDPELLLPSST